MGKMTRSVGSYQPELGNCVEGSPNTYQRQAAVFFQRRPGFSACFGFGEEAIIPEADDHCESYSQPD